MKQEQKQIAHVLSDIGMDEQLIKTMTNYSFHRDKLKSQEENGD